MFKFDQYDVATKQVNATEQYEDSEIHDLSPLSPKKKEYLETEYLVSQRQDWQEFEDPDAQLGGLITKKAKKPKFILTNVHDKPYFSNKYKRTHPDHLSANDEPSVRSGDSKHSSVSSLMTDSPRQLLNASRGSFFSNSQL